MTTPHRSPIVALALAGALALPAAAQTPPTPPPASEAKATRPDFTGVYLSVLGLGARRPATPTGGSGAGAAPAPRPLRGGAPAPGRQINLPPLNAEYKAKYDVIAASRASGSSEYDPVVHCLTPGMPNMMAAPYGMEIVQHPDKLVVYSEWMDAYRRIYLDGRTPTQAKLDDPTYAGYSTGRWEGDTLVVDTVAIREDTYLEFAGAQHSDAMTVRERIRFREPGILEDRMTITDPKALTKSYDIVRTFRKLAQPEDEVREFACTDGMQEGAPAVK